MMQHILYPVDFSPQCGLIAPAVAAMARRFACPVTKIFVARPPEGLTSLAPLQHHFRLAVEEMRGGLASYQSALFEGIETEAFVNMGNPVAEIVDLARRSPSGIIMMPTHGYSPFRQLLLGSVASGVLHDAECPVWTCAHAVAAEAVVPAAPRRIVCAVDLGPSTGAVLAAAREMATAFGASLHAVHVRNGVSPPDAPAEVETILGANIAAGVLKAEERYEAELLVIGRGKLQGVLGRLRSNVHDLVRYSQCPVFSL